MTGSAKTDLITHDWKSIFWHKHKGKSIHYQVSLPKWSNLEWSASAGCFFLAHCWSVRVVWVLGGALVRRQRTMCDCKALLSNKHLCCLLAIILANYEPCLANIKVYFTSSSSFNIFHDPPACHLPPPPPSHCWTRLILPSGSQPRWKNYLLLDGRKLVSCLLG